MKLITFLLFSATALVAINFPQSAKATVPTPSDGDFFMGFHSTGANNEYLVDVGQFTIYDNRPVGYHRSLGNYGTDLATVFGFGWQSNANVIWGVVGQTDPTGTTSTLFASRAEPSVGVFAEPWARQSSSSQNNTESTIFTMEFTDYFGQQETPNNPKGVIHPTTGNSWASYNNGPNSFGASFLTWVPTVEASSADGIVSTRLDLFRLDPNNTGTQQFGKYIGTFSIDGNGNVTYDVFATVSLPAVTLQVVDGSASEVPSNDTGSVRISRAGDTSSALTVSYSVGGTANNGKDYKKLRGTVAFRAGGKSVNLRIQAIDDALAEGDETVVLTLTPGTGYVVGTPNSGTIVIHSNE